MHSQRPLPSFSPSFAPFQSICGTEVTLGLPSLSQCRLAVGHRADFLSVSVKWKVTKKTSWGNQHPGPLQPLSAAGRGWQTAGGIRADGRVYPECPR